MIRTLLTFALSLMATVALAQKTVDWGEMVPEQVYEYEIMTPVQGYYTPTESGSMRCYTIGDIIHLYSDEAHENMIEFDQYYYGPDGDKVRIYTVEKGKTIYFYNGNPLDKGTFRFSLGKEEITLKETIPALDGSPLSISTEYRASYIFSIPVKCTKCKLEINGESAELIPEEFDSTIRLNWFATLRQWYNEGKISAGDILTVTITGLRDVNDSSNRPDFGDGLGKLVVRYTMAGAPAELIRQQGTPDSGVTDMKTYYLPDGDEGLVKLTFSAPLDPNCNAVAEIQYGDQDNIELGLYKEKPKVSIEGETLTVDLRGVKRFPEVMVPGLTPQETIGLRVSNIKSADGQFVLTGNIASPISFGFSYRLRTVVHSVAADWMPAGGSALAASTPMEIWVLGGQYIVFDSVDFTYLKDGVPVVVSVPYSDLRVENDPDEPSACLFHLSSPAFDADPGSEISVSFGGLACADGLDHTSDILIRYKHDTTAVGEIEAADADAPVYDLTGRRVMNPSKGIYIRSGRKIIL